MEVLSFIVPQDFSFIAERYDRVRKRISHRVQSWRACWALCNFHAAHRCEQAHQSQTSGQHGVYAMVQGILWKPRRLTDGLWSCCKAKFIKDGGHQGISLIQHGSFTIIFWQGHMWAVAEKIWRAPCIWHLFTDILLHQWWPAEGFCFQILHLKAEGVSKDIQTS